MLHSLLTQALHGVSGQLHALVDLSQGKNPQYPLQWRVAGAGMDISETSEVCCHCLESHLASSSLQHGHCSNGVILIL